MRGFLQCQCLHALPADNECEFVKECTFDMIPQSTQPLRNAVSVWCPIFNVRCVDAQGGYFVKGNVLILPRCTFPRACTDGGSLQNLHEFFDKDAFHVRQQCIAWLFQAVHCRLVKRRNVWLVYKTARREQGRREQHTSNDCILNVSAVLPLLHLTCALCGWMDGWMDEQGKREVVGYQTHHNHQLDNVSSSLAMDWSRPCSCS